MVPTTATSAICLKKKTRRIRSSVIRQDKHCFGRAPIHKRKGARRYATTKTHINCRCPP
jgi:hypothetical protein